MTTNYVQKIDEKKKKELFYFEEAFRSKGALYQFITLYNHIIDLNLISLPLESNIR